MYTVFSAQKFFQFCVVFCTDYCHFRGLEDFVEFVKDMASEGHDNLKDLKSRVSESEASWKKEMERCASQVDALEERYQEVKVTIEGSEESDKELDMLWKRVKTATTLMTYLKARARTMAVPHLAQLSCGIKNLEGIGIVDKEGIPLSSWSKSIDLSSLDEINSGSTDRNGVSNNKDVGCVGDLLKSVHMVTNVMESLVKRVIIAESETAVEKEKVNFGQEEIKRKENLLDSLSSKLEEMERFAFGTNCILNEMRQRVEDLVDETSRQRLRAAENEQELTRVKRDFESLKSYVSSLISVRETLISSEKQFQTIEKLFESVKSLIDMVLAPLLEYIDGVEFHKNEHGPHSLRGSKAHFMSPKEVTSQNQFAIGQVTPRFVKISSFIDVDTCMQNSNGLEGLLCFLL